MKMNGLMNLVLACCLLLMAMPCASAAEAPDCHPGSYRLDDGGLVDIDLRDDDGAYRWRRFDGATGLLHPSAGKAWSSTGGWTQDADGVSVSFPDCDAGVIDFNGVSGRRVAFDIKDVTFMSHGVTLAGRLTLPKGADKVPVVVLVHGAEDDSALSSPGVVLALQRMLPAEGIGVFAYDKRGTGRSGGQYTQDYGVLADDADAAMDQARGLAGARLGRIGFWGGSQGGWVAPLAANHTHADFVVVSYGLAVNVMDEDQESVDLQMREEGYPPEVIAEALEVAHAAEVVLVSDFKQGYPELDAMRAKYGKAPWYKDVQGDFAHFVLSHTDDAELRAMAKDYDWHIPFDYDSMSVLRADKTPQLWILGGEDYEAPSAVTSQRIRSLIADGKPFTLAYYPKAEHGMTLFETDAKGERVSTRYVPGYFAMIRDYVLTGRLPGSYGDAEISYPRTPSGPEAGKPSL
jgi:hypothetical protein